MFSVMPGAEATAPAGGAYCGGGTVEPRVAPAAAASPIAVPHFGQNRPSTDVPQLGQKAITLILLILAHCSPAAAIWQGLQFLTRCYGKTAIVPRVFPSHQVGVENEFPQNKNLDTDNRGYSYCRRFAGGRAAQQSHEQSPAENGRPTWPNRRSTGAGQGNLPGRAADGQAGTAAIASGAPSSSGRHSSQRVG